MPRDVPIGNGTLLAAFDYQLRDFYYPRLGKENHALGYPWRFGVWLDGEFSWLNRQNWTLHLDYVTDAVAPGGCRHRHRHARRRYEPYFYRIQPGGCFP